ncbi:MAG: helix-turn-helix domain-containing protein [Oscillospiraceae bacterium]
MKYFSVKKVLPMEFFCCGNLVSKDEFLHCRRAISCDVLIFVLSGELNISIFGEEHTISSGEFIFLPNGTEHFGFMPSSGELSYMWVHFKSSSMLIQTDDKPPVLSPQGYCLPLCGKADLPDRVRLLFSQLLSLSHRKSFYSDEMISALLSVILMELSQSGETVPLNLSPAVAAAAEWIKSNCCSDISSADAAQSVHYNAEYLSAIFKKETGFTLTEYINRSRIETAKHILSDSSVTIKEAAFSCGFSDEKYFMRVFKKIEGMTPSEYRNAL